ncbi:RNA polymerase recycling motor HelD [Shouchella patagoniensis]|uniref:RNA polymerase recycling motor HelD n=1 Tax=Shouchella patagoniensis TaxID=228576 RepID=UPI000994EAC0|nr:RNA polymerase recycling motor HelD [Shouchella patagoniensis]
MQYEYERAAFIHAFIRTKQAMLKDQLEGVSGDEMELKETFWDNVTMNFSNTEDAQETISSIKQQAELLNERERSSELMKKQMRTLRRLADSPYFGRIDMKEKGADTPDALYIGLASLMDETDSEFLIYDWRAPISSVYYDSEVGPVSYEAPVGTVKGELVGKRQYVFRRGELKALFDTSLAIGDDRLKEALSNEASTNMKTIVSTIQKEQNQAIRNENSRFLIVQGVAGSGKTSVAMQRAAYLLFRHREQLDANQLILFSPNELFSNYVSTVLPELGEENMIQLTFRGYLFKRLSKTYMVEDGFEQLEYMLQANNDELYRTRLVSISTKSSMAFKEKMDQFINGLETGGVPFKDIRFRNETILSKEDTQTYFYCLDHTISLQNRLRLTAEWLLKELAKHEGKERSSKWVEETRELLDKETLLAAHHEILAEHPNEDVFNEEEQQFQNLAKQITRAAFMPLKRRVKSYSFVDAERLYEQFLFDSCHEETEGFAAAALFSMNEINNGRIPHEDATPFLYLQDRIKGLRVDRSIKHIFIDEAQDYSYFQLMYLKMLYPAAKYTIVGDSSQALYAHSKNDPVLMDLSDTEETTTKIVFRKSYRSTEPIMKFARELLVDPNVVEPFEREGTSPVLVECTNRASMIEPMKNKIETLLESGVSTLAVITKTANEAADAHARLSEWIDIQLVAKDHHEYNEGAVVLPVYLAKGIEFDAVIVFDASDSQYSTDQERHHLYTACTRAMHTLVLFSSGHASRWINHIPRQLYTKQALS